MEANNQRILNLLFRSFAVKCTITSLAKEMGISRVGIWKSLKRMESRKLIILTSIGNRKTSAYIISLNLENILTLKNLEITLTEEAIKNKRWVDNFKELEKKVDFLILFGSILHSPEEANDIDILSIANKNKFTEINETVNRIQKTQIKKIHALNLTEEEFKEELIKNNKAFIDTIKKGIVLFGQEKFIKFIRGITI
ncbi:MAG: hypothetical protein AABW41_05650 [Nanoarchaeota archaeon]